MMKAFNLMEQILAIYLNRTVKNTSGFVSGQLGRLGDTIKDGV
jgi:hypothetical protein